MSIYKLAPNSPSVAIGDIVCVDLEGLELVTKATPAALASASAALGIAQTSSLPSQPVTVADVGTVDRTITGLGPGFTSMVRVNDAARCERLLLPFGGDFIVGVCDTQGNVTIQPHSEIGTGPQYVLNVRLFGAKADSDGIGGGTDAAPAINAAILALDPERGGIVEIPYGKYRIATTINVQRGVTLRGAGGGSLIHPPTELVADAGVTAIMVWGFDGGAPDHINSADGAFGAVIESMVITAAGKDPEMVTGSYTNSELDSSHVTLSSPGLFKKDQMVRIGGAAQLPSRLQRITASTVAGSDIVTLNSPIDKKSAGLREGMWLQIVTPGDPKRSPFPTPCKVLKVIDNQLQMRDPALVLPGQQPGDKLDGLPINYIDDFYARIIDISLDRMTLTLDNTISSHNFQATTPNTEISHGDCGIYARAKCTIRDVAVGRDLLTDFVGCGVFIYGSHGAPVPCNANGWRVENLAVGGCRHALKVQGTDGNAGKCEQLYAYNAHSWTVLDMSFLGNEYASAQMSGGSGILTFNNSPCACTITGAYNEEGTISHFGDGTIVVGGTLAQDAGGYSWVGGRFNRVYIGGIDGAMFTHQTDANPTANWFNFQQVGSKSGLSFRGTRAEVEGTRGYFVWIHEDSLHGFRAHPILISDFDTGLGSGTSEQSAGELWFPQGFWFGEREDLRLPLPSEARKYTLGSSTPKQGNSRQGDVHFYRDLVAGGYIGWACTRNGANPSTAVHTTFGEIVSNDLLVKDVSTGTVMLDTNECAHRRIRFSGALTGNVDVIVQTPAVISQGANPSAPNSFDKIFQNQTTGAFVFTLKTVAADPGIALAQGKTQHMWSDGTNIFAVAGST